MYTWYEDFFLIETLNVFNKFKMNISVFFIIVNFVTKCLLLSKYKTEKLFIYVYAMKLHIKWNPNNEIFSKLF